jgi:hypothetical protein
MLRTLSRLRTCLRLSFSLAALFGLASFAPGAALDDAIKTSKQTGKPILVVQGRENCGVCQALKRRMESDAKYKALSASYVYLHIDIDKEKDVRSAWSKLFASSETSLPIVQVVSPDGREIYDKGGMVESSVLEDLLKKSGKIFSPQVLAKIKKALDDATKAYDEGNVSKAVSTISPVLNSGGAGETVISADAFGKKLVEECQMQLTDAEEKLGTEDTAVEGALAMLKVSRDYAKLKPVAADLKKVAVKKAHKDFRPIFDQAKEIDQADMMVVNKKPEQAKRAYEAVIKKHPDSAVAKLAQAKLDEMAAGDTAEKSASAKPDASATN